MQILKNAIRVIREVSIMILSWLLELLEGDSSSAREKRKSSEKTKSQGSYMPEANEKIHKLEIEVNRLNNSVADLREKLQYASEERQDLRKRLNSVTGEVQHDFDSMRKELEKYVNAEISKLRKEFEQPQAPPPPLQKESSKQYFESSVDGAYLINMTQMPNLCSNFIELDTNTGYFSIVNTDKCVEFILANRDYALTSCIVNIASSAPSSVRVDEEGIAVKEMNSTDWKVTKKMKITLY